MEGIEVRTEQPSDFQAIDVVNLSAFEGEDEAKLVAELRQATGYSQEFSLVAEFNGRLVGHLMLTPGKLQQAGKQTDVLILAPMSVVPSQSHRGIGTALVEAAIAKGRAGGYAAIIVVGKPDYYAKLGFESSDKLKISCNLPVPDDAIMAIELDAGKITSGGVVEYPSSFLSLY